MLNTYGKQQREHDLHSHLQHNHKNFASATANEKTSRVITRFLAKNVMPVNKLSRKGFEKLSGPK